MHQTDDRPKFRLRSVFISDVHLGSPDCRAGELLRFLEKNTLLDKPAETQADQPAVAPADERAGELSQGAPAPRESRERESSAAPLPERDSSM